MTAARVISAPAETFAQTEGFEAASVVLKEAGTIVGGALLCGIAEAGALSYEQVAVQVAYQMDPTTSVKRLQSLYEAAISDATPAFRQYGGPRDCGKILQAYAEGRKQLGLRQRTPD